MTARTERYDEVLAMRRCHKDVNKCIGDRMSECRSDSWRDKESGEAGKSHAWRGWPIRVCWSTGLFHKRGWVPVTSSRVIFIVTRSTKESSLPTIQYQKKSCHPAFR